MGLGPWRAPQSPGADASGERAHGFGAWAAFIGRRQRIPSLKRF
jgi:hypothetical protein